MSNEFKSSGNPRDDSQAAMNAALGRAHIGAAELTRIDVVINAPVSADGRSLGAAAYLPTDFQGDAYRFAVNGLAPKALFSWKNDLLALANGDRLHRATWPGAILYVWSTLGLGCAIVKAGGRPQELRDRHRDLEHFVHEDESAACRECHSSNCITWRASMDGMLVTGSRAAGRALKNALDLNEFWDDVDQSAPGRNHLNLSIVAWESLIKLAAPRPTLVVVGGRAGALVGTLLFEALSERLRIRMESGPYDLAGAA